ncbi:MAG: capsule biosynthesis protein, partial [Rhodobacteraceae bacterium CG2_30_10_405]
MTIKLTAKRFRIRRPEPVVPSVAAPAAAELHDDGFGTGRFPTANPDDIQTPGEVAGSTDIETIRREGLTGRQLRMARRVAQKYDLPATSDFDAIRLLRKAGIDPFQRTNMLDLVTSDGTALARVEPSRAMTTVPGDGVKLPQILKPIQVPTTEVRAEQSHLADLMHIQQDITRRRRRKVSLLAVRMLFFVFLPTLLTGFYYYRVATPLYATEAEFVIQQASSPAAAGGLGGLLSGSPLATSQDSITVQGYLQSRDAMMRLDTDHGFRSHFSAPQIDPIQRLAPDATLEAAYKVYARNVKISYDPTEGLIKMEVSATDPQVSVAFAKALITYAEEQVDQLTLRLRGDQMTGARESFDKAEAEMLAAQRRVVDLQERYKILSSEAEVALLTSQIGALETQLTTDRLSLQQMESNAAPNLARMDPLKRRMAALEGE